jgi:uncharacterized protein (UPF0212 family)
MKYITLIKNKPDFDFIEKCAGKWICPECSEDIYGDDCNFCPYCGAEIEWVYE